MWELPKNTGRIRVSIKFTITVTCPLPTHNWLKGWRGFNAKARFISKMDNHSLKRSNRSARNFSINEKNNKRKLF